MPAANAQGTPEQTQIFVPMLGMDLAAGVGRGRRAQGLGGKGPGPGHGLHLAEVEHQADVREQGGAAHEEVACAHHLRAAGRGASVSATGTAKAHVLTSDVKHECVRT